MRKPILFLRLEAPLQSWGSRSRWDVRDTASEPTKSGIVGLLGCALGYPMRDSRLEHLDSALRFGVRVEHPGRVLIDYQTITDFLPSADGRFKHSGTAMAASIDKLKGNPDALAATIQSPRSYIEDGAFLVALEAADAGNTLLDECARALEQPRWPLFLGRKACVPTRPVFETLSREYRNLEDALRQHPWSWLGRALQIRPGRKPQSVAAFVEVPPGHNATGMVSRQDALRTNAARAYTFCSMQRMTVDLPAGDDADLSISPDRKA
jgi:CRISPR system Cascade subunit CasD